MVLASPSIAIMALSSRVNSSNHVSKSCSSCLWNQQATHQTKANCVSTSSKAAAANEHTQHARKDLKRAEQVSFLSFIFASKNHMNCIYLEGTRKLAKEGRNKQNSYIDQNKSTIFSLHTLSHYLKNTTSYFCVCLTRVQGCLVSGSGHFSCLQE